MTQKIYRLVTALLAFSCTARLANGHSWIACTDYAEKNAAIYDHNLCRGYAREARILAPRGETFGLDRGYDYKPSETAPCQRQRNDQNYDFNHPMAVYYPGQQVVLAHPMKNHGSDGCTNPYIPDNGNWLYHGGRNAVSDPTLSAFRGNIVADLGKSPTGQNYKAGYPKPGYQNAPNFCDGTDKALGTYSFNVPSNMQPGNYTFMWLWAFNGAGDLYSSCFEVEVVGSLSKRNSKLQSKGLSNFYEPCGLKTSDGVTEGNSNPGCTPVGSSSSSTVQSSSTSRMVTTATKTTTTKATTQQPGVVMASVQTHQMTGEVVLPPADSRINRRYLSVHWDCPVVANFWNVRVTGLHNVGENKRRKRHVEGVHYDLIQEGSDVASGVFFYHATFTSPCDLLAYPPIAKVIRDEV